MGARDAREAKWEADRKKTRSQQEGVGDVDTIFKSAAGLLATPWLPALGGGWKEYERRREKRDEQVLEPATCLPTYLPTYARSSGLLSPACCCAFVIFSFILTWDFGQMTHGGLG